MHILIFQSEDTLGFSLPSINDHDFDATEYRNYVLANFSF